MSAALARTQAEIANLRSRMTATRARADRAAASLQADATAVAVAYAYARWKRDQTQPFQLLGMSPEVSAAIVLWVVGEFADGDIGRLAHAGAIGIAASFAAQEGARR